MPSPIAHPAASIPFAKVGLVFSALVVGSIAPDLGYAVQRGEEYFMYTIPGLFLFDLPVGLVLLWLFHTVAKWPLLSLFPESLQRRLFHHAQGFTFGPPKRFALILLSLLVGSITHVILDSFTHSFGWTVQHFAFLRVSIDGAPFFRILQNLGTVVGVGLLIYWFVRWLPTAPQSDQLLPRFSRTVQMFFLALIALSLPIAEGLLIYLRLSSGTKPISVRFLMYSTIFSAVPTVSFFAGVYCLAWMHTFYKTIHSPRVTDPG